MANGAHEYRTEDHRLSIAEVARKYGTLLDSDDLSRSPGLSAADVERNRASFGANKMAEPERPSHLRAYLEYLHNLFSYVLILCGIISLAIYPVFPDDFVHLYVGIVLIAIAFINGFLEYYQKYKSEELLKGFMTLVPSRCLVQRNNEIMEVDADAVVVGDIILVKAGNKIAADGRVIHASGLKIDNSSLTGESEPQERDAELESDDMGPMDARCLIFSGTSVAAGEGLAIVTRIGSDTAIGQIAQMAGSSAPTESQLTHEMDAAVRLLVLCGLTTSITLLTIVFAQGFGLANAVQVTIGSLLSFLPQGLPATVTVSLTVAAKRLAKQNVLVKNLRGIETLGTITLLATDKTGTLTMNKMTVVALWSGEEIVSLAEEAEKEAFVGGAKEQYNELLEACALCTNIRVLEGGDLLGDATEQGIYQFVTEQLQYKPPLSFTRTHEIPFTSKTKRHLIAGSVNGEGSRTRIYMKGAPERVLERCRGNDEQFRVRVDEIYTRMAGMGWRVLAFGSRDVEGSVEQHALEEIQDLTFQGLLALQDPPKPGVADTMRKLRRAGIQLIMVTGDHPLTASAIARQIGLITKPLAGSIGEVSAGTAFAVHGDALRSLTAADWERLFSTDELIFARTQPQQKLQIVSSFQGHGHIVGASGDGVNDAPALKVADLGISMNETAADVSKNAADIILLDDDFSTIAIGVFEGRLVFENLKKSLRYTLTHIVPELSSLAVTAIAGIPLPLSAILILVFDVFCEPGPAMSYAFEAAPVNLLKLKPRLRRRAKSGHQHGWAAYFGLGSKGGERLIDKDMVLWCFFQGGIIIACGCFGAYIVSMALSKVPLSSLFHAANKYFEGRIGVTVSSLVLTDGNVAGVAVQEEILAKAQSSYFLSLIIGQHFNLFLTKHRYRYPHGWDIFYNRYTYLGMLISGGIGALIVFVPPFQAAFGTSSVYAASIACAFVTGGMLVFYEYVRRYLRFTGIVGKPPEGRILMKSQ